jgi:CheY-like chemotaxis protein
MPLLFIVENDEAYRQFLSIALKMTGYDIHSVRGGAEAIEILSDSLPDLVILDLSMPHVTGWDVYHFMRNDPALQHVPVLVITANADEQTRRQSLNERVNGLLVKPVSLDEILEAVQKLVPLP